MGVEEIGALRQENIRLKRRVEVEDKGKENETLENMVSVHKISLHQHTVNENEGESGYKTRGAIVASLATRTAR